MIGVGEELRIYVIGERERGQRTQCITPAWLREWFGTQDLVLMTRFIGRKEFRVLARKKAEDRLSPSVIGDTIRGPVAIIGYDPTRDCLRDLSYEEVNLIVWSTHLCRWEDDGDRWMCVSVEMHRSADDRCPIIEVSE